MSNHHLIIPERSRDIGDFLVGRLLPFRKKRMVGPFIFIDHMGPMQLGPKKYLDVDQHPHIGLATLTYLISGELMHADSIGTLQRIAPGDVNLMVAGKGVTHTERTPADLRGQIISMQGYQIWIALPKTHEQIAPSFTNIKANELPKWEDQGAQFTLVAGTAFGKTAPVPVFSPLFMVEVNTLKDYTLDIASGLVGEVGVLVSKGAVVACGEQISAGNMLIGKKDNVCKLEIKANSKIFLFGGEPFKEERFIYWNFVSSSQDSIAQAKADWQQNRFPKVPNDNSYVSLPE